jgi:cytochrome bd-type quinol oxidase subunit 1
MEFQFGTNWAQFSRLTGGVIAQPLAMEGVFSFFLESAFLGLFLFGETRLSRLGHWAAAFMIFAGSWLSGFFIVMADAWMQHPVAYTRLPDGSFEVNSLSGVLTNPWGLIQYAHTMSGALTTGAFAMAATGAFYLLSHRDTEFGRLFVKVGVVAGILATVAQIFPTRDLHGKYMAAHQPVTTAAMEALFHTEIGAPLVVIGQPDVEHERIDNPQSDRFVCSGGIPRLPRRRKFESGFCRMTAAAPVRVTSKNPLSPVLSSTGRSNAEKSLSRSAKSDIVMCWKTKLPLATLMPAFRRPRRASSLAFGLAASS